MIIRIAATLRGKRFPQLEQRFIKGVWWAGVTGTGLGLALLLYWVDPTQINFLPHCPIRAITNQPCPGCGMTQAVHHLLRGQWQVALRLNPRIIIVLPLITVWFLHFTRDTFTDPDPSCG